MCIDCFTEEINGFASTYSAARAAFETFKLQLAQKLGNSQLRLVKVEKGIDYVRSEYFWDIFVCTSCGQKWTLFEPFKNNEGRKYTGYFVRYKPNFWERLKASLAKLFGFTAAL